ncbi:PDZ domain-containing protein [Planctomycetes bacterium TBK1r]|uniref:Serine protease Do-like HtrA n=1 Tax=Stieleria magnilauensis TaxID=2527963 RepID=A0ABX5XSZ5_9BACT|nr:Serine protease Do-like HtrA [Planctomycetes bacterium TBK1r]
MRVKNLLCVTALAGASMALPTGNTTAQDLGQAVPTTQNGLGNAVDNAVRSGIGAAADQIRQGGSVRGAIQQGADQALRQGADQALRQGADQAIREGVNQATRQVLPNANINANVDANANVNGNRNIAGSNVAAQQRARLGIGLQSSDQGIRITNVTQGSAAARAGLQAGDVVISTNGQAITSTDQLAQIVRDADANAQLQMKVLRNGQEQAVTASLAARQQQNDRYRANKPAMDGSANASAAYEARITALEDEIERLKSTIDQLRGEFDVQGDVQGNIQDNGQSRRDRNTSLNADGSLEADVSLDSGLDVDASGSASTDADLEGSLDN